MIEQWIEWKPIQGLEENYYYVELISNNGIGEFKMQLASDNKAKLIVLFENSVNAYKRTDESFRQSTVADILYNSGAIGPFFKINNSNFVQSLLQQPGETANPAKFIHFVFVEYNSIIDVIATYEPKVILINNAQTT